MCESRENLRRINPNAILVEAASPLITVDRPELIRGKRVLVVEDGPTLTHGHMRIGAGTSSSSKIWCSWSWLIHVIML